MKKIDACNKYPMEIVFSKNSIIGLGHVQFAMCPWVFRHESNSNNDVFVSSSFCSSSIASGSIFLIPNQSLRREDDRGALSTDPWFPIDDTSFPPAQLQEDTVRMNTSHCLICNMKQEYIKENDI